jgi:hypothetical protein
MGSKEITPVIASNRSSQNGTTVTPSTILKTTPTVPRKTFRHFPRKFAHIDALESAVISIDLSAHAEWP